MPKMSGYFYKYGKDYSRKPKSYQKTKKSERFDRNKIYLGIFRAVNESKWISRDQGRIIAKIVTDTVEQELIKMKKTMFLANKLEPLFYSIKISIK